MPQGASVLLVEDEESVRDVLTDLLMGAGYTVESAMTRSAALALLEARRFDIVLLDAVIPGGSAEQVAERAARDRIPVLVTSGHPERIEDLSNGEKHPFLAKPFRVGELLERMAQMLKDAPQGEAVPRVPGPS